MEHAKLVESVKELVAEPAGRIKLDDLVSEEIRALLDATSTEHFPVQASNIQPEEFGERLRKYEGLTQNLISVAILLARWGDAEHLLLLEKIFKRVAEGAERESAGVTMWLHLGWYPTHLLMYAAGMSAVASKKYDALRIALNTPVHFRGQSMPVVMPSVVNMTDVTTWFKGLPGMERRHTPRSDYLFEALKSPLEQALFVGGDYESVFNKFESHLALSCSTASPHRFGPIGRFGWSHSYTDQTTELDRVIAESVEEGDSWLPFKVGMYKDKETFEQSASDLQARQKRLGWD